jgi:hypothetical protein
MVDVRRRRGRGSESAAKGVGFRPVNSPPASTYIGHGSTRTGRIKTFMGRAASMGSDRRRLFCRTINLPE